MYGFKLHTIGGVKSRHVGLPWDPIMEGDARYHWAAIGEVNSAAAAIIAAECTPPQESRYSSSAGLGHFGIVKLNFN